MKIEKTGLEGVFVIVPAVYEDERGYFLESYNRRELENHGINYVFVQDNESSSRYGIIRGLHYQLEPYAQTKLVRVIDGRIYDVAVDIRRGSPTYGKWAGIELSSVNKKQLLVPRGFAHGFAVLSATAIVSYKCDQYYHKESESGIIYNDQSIGISWPLDDKDVLLNQRDRNFLPLSSAKNNFAMPASSPNSEGK